MIAPFGPRIAHADKKRQGSKHIKKFTLPKSTMGALY